MQVLVRILSSKRVLAAITALAVTLLKTKLGIDEQTALEIVGIVVALIVGDSISAIDPHKRIAQERAARGAP